jgi:hypothetical protein
MPYIVVALIGCVLCSLTACRCREKAKAGTAPVPACAVGAAVQPTPSIAAEGAAPAADALAPAIGEVEQKILKTGEALILAERKARETNETVKASFASLNEARTAYYQVLGGIDEIKTLREEQSALEERYRELLAERSRLAGGESK